MSSDEKNESLENLKDKLRSLFGLKAPQKKMNALPPKTRFSIWYFLIVFFTISYLQQYYFSSKVETIPYSQFKQHIAHPRLQFQHRFKTTKSGIHIDIKEGQKWRIS
jgi:hypothetical protein